ncbi:U-Kazal-Dg21.2-like isoform X1 [Rhodnius prolixus]|uniref:U-Kazal-Dg21.2-like isoform X1 n=1 Tax=Rhodnius prolixus TaxID=13249 RepID=UPI003D18A979
MQFHILFHLKRLTKMKFNSPVFTLCIITMFYALCLVKLAEGQQQCNIPCTGEYNPVCGQQNDFFRIFSNRCRLERENFCGANPRWNFVRVGQCP